jgi:hypothetical protein
LKKKYKLRVEKRIKGRETEKKREWKRNEGGILNL